MDKENGSMRQLVDVVVQAYALTARIPDSLIACVGHFSIAAVFWKSGQTKVEGFVIDLVDGVPQLGVPHLCSSAVGLLRALLPRSPVAGLATRPAAAALRA
jgi:putative oxidoreductase